MFFRLPLLLLGVVGESFEKLVVEVAFLGRILYPAYDAFVGAVFGFVNLHLTSLFGEGVFGEVEKDMHLELETCDMPESVIPSDKAYRLIMALCECPHGMIAMSKEMPGLVETSTNLASIKMKEGYIEFVQDDPLYIRTVPADIRKKMETINAAIKDGSLKL